MGKTLKYGDFEFPQGNRIAVRPFTSRARPMKKGGPVQKFDDGGMVPPPDQVYGALNQLRTDAGPSGLGGPSTGLGGPGSAQNLHEMNQVNAGHAPFTAKGIGQALQNALGVIGATGALTTGLGSMVETAAGQPGSGTYGGLQDIEGQQAFTPAEKAYIAAGGTMQGALARSANQRAAAEHGGGAGAEHDRQGVSAGAGPGGRAARGGGAYGGMGGVGGYGMRKGGRVGRTKT